MKMELSKGIYVFDDFLNKKECLEYINMIDDSILNEKQICFSDNSGSINHKYIDLELATKFYDRLVESSFSNEKLGKNIKKIKRPNNLIMWARYDPETDFGLHTDTGLFYDSIKREKSRWTLLIYLNNDFNGGSTVFYDDNFKEILTVEPQAGTCVLFDIDLWHKGTKVLDSRKYWIGCEIIGDY